MRGTGVHHFDLVVSELDRSLEFYRGLLEPLGYTQAAAIVGERGERVVYLGGPGIVPVSLRQAQTSDRHDRYRIGVHHVAFEAPSRESRRRATALGAGQGVDIENNPKEYTCRAITPVSSTTRTASSSKLSTFHDAADRRQVQ